MFETSLGFNLSIRFSGMFKETTHSITNLPSTHKALNSLTPPLITQPPLSVLF